MTDVAGVAVTKQVNEVLTRRVLVRGKKPAIQPQSVRSLKRNVLERAAQLAPVRVPLARRLINLTMFKPAQHKINNRQQNQWTNHPHDALLSFASAHAEECHARRRKASAVKAPTTQVKIRGKHQASRRQALLQIYWCVKVEISLELWSLSSFQPRHEAQFAPTHFPRIVAFGGQLLENFRETSEAKSAFEHRVVELRNSGEAARPRIRSRPTFRPTLQRCSKAKALPRRAA